MLRDDCPMLMLSRLRTRRSSTMRPPWTMPMRMIFGFGKPPGPWGGLAAGLAMEGYSTSSRLEGRARHAVQDLGYEILLQLLPIVIDAGFLKDIEGFRLLDFAVDVDGVDDPVDSLPTGTPFHLH